MGEVLVEHGWLSAADLVKALALRAREDVALGEILLAHGMVAAEELHNGLAKQYGAARIDAEATPPDVRLVDALGPEDCLRNGLLPWRGCGAVTVVATCRPDRFEAHRTRLEALFGPVRIGILEETELHAALLRLRQRALAARAEARLPPAESCRGWSGRQVASVTGALMLSLGALWAMAPALAFALVAGWATIMLLAGTLLRATAAMLRIGHMRQALAPEEPGTAVPATLPRVSILVPLFREREIAAHLIRRLGKLTYPRELLDICLVVEEDDTITQATIAATRLPPWMRRIVVPRGGVQTKPRAMNFALQFCRGSIVGIYDAEDAPAPDQLHRIARRFAEAGPEVACLQGVLDYYNAQANWLSRCFTVEYASWFRVILPGFLRMGLVIPLGGTTLFFRREALERLGGWDAHNVTEDADLGVRLARHGYRTELVDTVTEEEANCGVLTWVRQRSRWLKGYAMTYAVHMRRPALLWRELGPWRFFGIQVLFLGTLTQFVLAPALWSFWFLLVGLPHPLADAAPSWVFVLLGTLFLASELVNIALGALSVATPQRRWLIKWVPTLHLYFLLGALAAYKAVWEMITRPFFWDKTNHGAADPLPFMAALAADAPPPGTGPERCAAASASADGDPDADGGYSAA